MSVLLRHPASVPALFAKGLDPDVSSSRFPGPWRRLARAAPLGAAAAVLLMEVPLVKAAAAAVSLALPR